MNLDFLDKDLPFDEGFKKLQEYDKWRGKLADKHRKLGHGTFGAIGREISQADWDKASRFENDNFMKYCKELDIQLDHPFSFYMTEYGYEIDDECK